MSASSLPVARRVVAVLGMHRSGTSWLAGSLEELGVELGEVSTADPHNKKGNRESPELMALHDAVLGDNDGSWKKPPRRAAWSAERVAALRAYVERMNAAYPLWGFKDPRVLLAFDAWIDAVPGLVRVGIYRHPLAVHRSLSARSERFDRSRSVKLWNAYNERLIAEHRRSPFPLLRFDVAAAELAAEFRVAAAALGLPDPDRDAASFFEESLVHNNDAAEESIPFTSRRLWAYLEEHRIRV